jgi:hypothetical protein
MHGWWMFPFERIIGALQKTNMNYKIGEHEWKYGGDILNRVLQGS